MIAGGVVWLVMMGLFAWRLLEPFRSPVAPPTHPPSPSGPPAPSMLPNVLLILAIPAVLALIMVAAAVFARSSGVAKKEWYIPPDVNYGFGDRPEDRRDKR